MKLWQVSIFGEYEQVIEKDNKEYKPRKLSKKDRILQQKIKKLYDIYEKLYKAQNISILEQREVIMKEGLIIYPDEQQAEPIETAQMTIKDIDKKISVAQEKLKFEFMKELQ